MAHTFLPVEVQLGADMAKREITAYASVFGNRDAQGMRVMPGAFQKSIAERLPNRQIKLMRNHETLVGTVRHAEEDGFGLLTVGYVSKTVCGDECLELVKDGTLNRYSFRAKIVRANVAIDGEDAAGFPIETLELKELGIKECGPVDLDPANELARVITVKSLDGDFLDVLSELPYLVNLFTLGGREAKLSADERRVCSCLVRLREELDKRGDALKALLAPESSTSPYRATPDNSTPADAEKSLDLSPLLESLRMRGRIAA
jgi:HK97 family phage prohead protease